MKVQLKSSILILLTTLISCKTHELIEVKVVDKHTNQPIDSVLVEVTDGEKSYGGDRRSSSVTGYTDSAGNFKASLPIGFVFGTNKIHLEYSKKGFSHKSELNKTKGVVELEK